MKLLGISGSLRQDSFNTRLLQLVAQLLPPEINFQLYTCGELPLYNQELDGAEKPSAVKQLLDRIGAADGLLISTPEYNYSVPGVLKNALDWASRPAFQSLLKGRPTAVLSASMSNLGGVRAQIHLKQILGSTLTPVYPAPDFIIPAAHQLFPETGLPTDPDLEKRLQKFIAGFISWAQNHQ